MLQGLIVPLPEHAWGTEEEGRCQVERANEALSGLSSAVLMEIAALNYGAVFTDDTMANAALTLSKSNIDELIKSSDIEAMNHLTISNWGIGQGVATVVQSAMRLGKKIRVIDIGSGPGGTLAAAIASITASVSPKQMPEISMVALEATPKFHDQLDAFARSEWGAQRLGMTVANTKAGSPDIDRPRTFTTVYGNAVEAVNHANWAQDSETITIVTANYSLHRMPMDAKEKIFEVLGRLPHVTLLLCDLRENSSKINRQYFNLGVNGPLNSGNVGLEQLLRNNGFEVEDTSRRLPSGINVNLATRLDLPENDGHFICGATDPLARSALDFVTHEQDSSLSRTRAFPNPAAQNN